jgi:hypothetical protein
MNTVTVASSEVYAAVRDALAAGLRIIREHEASGAYMLGRFDFPEIGRFESGLPHFSQNASPSDKTPKDYKSRLP